ncbi:MAG: DNA primase [Lactovum sp.]
MAIPNEKISEIRSAVDLADFIGQFVKLTKVGQNLQGLCPFHSENSPSFSVNLSKSIFKCFGCGKGGSVFNFVMEYRKVDFLTAVQEVASFSGIELNLQKNDSIQNNPYAKLYDINNQANTFYKSYLLLTKQGEEAKSYLLNRGLDEATIKYFDIGLSSNLPNLLYKNLSNKFEEEVLLKSGLFNFVNYKVYDTFQDRLMFAIHNSNGQTVAFSGRRWKESDERQGKYVNTSTTEIFEKSNLLYNLHRAKSMIKKTQEVYLMEGFMDVIAAYRSGITNVVAIMGTALTSKHVKQLSYLTKKIILVTDGDKAGQAAVEKALQEIKSMDVQIVKIPEEKDPDDYLQSYGKEAFSDLLVNSRLGRTEFLIDSLNPKSLKTITDQLEYLQKVAEILSLEKDEDILDIYIQRLVKILPDFDQEHIEKKLKKNKKKSYINSPMDSFEGMEAPIFDDYVAVDSFEEEKRSQSAPIQIKKKKSVTQKLEMQLLHAMIFNPEWISKLSQLDSFKILNSDLNLLFESLIIEEMTSGTIKETFSQALPRELEELYIEIVKMNLPKESSEVEIKELLELLEKERMREQIEILKSGVDEISIEEEREQRLGNITHLEKHLQILLRREI